MEEKKKIRESFLTSTTLETKRTGLSKDDIKASFLKHLFYGIGRIPKVTTLNDLYTALALTIRDRVFRQFVRTTEQIAV